MKRTAFLIFFALLSVAVIAQDKPKKEKKEKVKKEKVEKVDLAEREQMRPVNPWVFEAGLEEKPGRVVVALNKSLWVAYDTTTCSIMRVWKGSAFVNTGSPIKAMVTEGFNYVENPGTQDVWMVKKGNKSLLKSVKYDGYEMAGDKVHLIFKLTLEDGRSFQIKENPEYGLQKKPNANRTTFTRTFTMVNPPNGVDVMLSVEVSDLAKMGDLKTSGKFSKLKKSKRMYDWGDLFSAKGAMILNSSKASTLTTTFTIDGETYYKNRPSSTN
ncbi:MAG: hypothetical protein AAFR87_01120 [Bacteroidota bacterium]